MDRLFSPNDSMPDGIILLRVKQDVRSRRFQVFFVERAGTTVVEFEPGVVVAAGSCVEEKK
jgi:hypothetical protein